MLTLDTMKKTYGFLDGGMTMASRVMKKLYSPVQRFLFPRSNGYKWTPNVEVSPLEAENSMRDIFSEGIRSCVRIDALFVGSAVVFGFSLPTAILVALLHFSLYTLWSYKVVSKWSGSSMLWMKTAVVWLVAISAIYLSLVKIFAESGLSWYNESVMVLGMLTLWMAQLVPLERALRRLNKEAPVGS